jgi:hypothetical protein
VTAPPPAAVGASLPVPATPLVGREADLANPTSNHVYQAIGYRSVCDVDAYDFVPLP